MKAKHLILYDGDCPLCNRVVRFLLIEDKKGIFLFSPLQGKSAKPFLKSLKRKSFDTLVLVQFFGLKHEKVFIEGKATLRILWLLGGSFAFLGVLSFLPSFIFDVFYRFIAKRRFLLFPKKMTVDVSQFKDRFLQ